MQGLISLDGKKWILLGMATQEKTAIQIMFHAVMWW